VTLDGLRQTAIPKNDSAALELVLGGLSALPQCRGSTQTAWIGGGPTREVFAEWIAAENEARRALGDEAFERARAEGFSLTLEEAVSYALERSG
jgi:hypothetical protein